MTLHQLAPGLSEAVFQQRVIDLCAWLGLRWHHETDSRRSRAGFPDLVIVGRHGLGFFELKTDKGRLRPEQADWLHDLRALTRSTAAYAGPTAGPFVLAEVWRPRDWVHVEHVLFRLAGRRFTGPPDPTPNGSIR